MLKLFQSLFGAKPAGSALYDRIVVEAAIDRALDATDPRMRSISGHRKRLEPAVVKAIDHVIALVSALPPPVEASARTYGEDERLSSFFASVARMSEVFGADRALLDFLDSPQGGADPVYALLVVERTEKKVLGMAVQGEHVQREVSQVQVSFDKHRLLEPQASVEENRRLVMRRAFDQILAVALTRITLASKERESLEAGQSVLKAKLRALQSSNFGLAGGEGGEPVDAAALEAKLAQIERELEATGTGAATLPRHLDILVETLDKAQEQLFAQRLSILMDRLGIRQDAPGGTTVQLDLVEVRNANGRAVVVLPIAIPRDAIAKRDVFAEAKRLLI
jgi:hypothetical protein